MIGQCRQGLGLFEGRIHSCSRTETFHVQFHNPAGTRIVSKKTAVNTPHVAPKSDEGGSPDVSRHSQVMPYRASPALGESAVASAPLLGFDATESFADFGCRANPALGDDEDAVLKQFR
jgi:hypothetical protein